MIATLLCLLFVSSKDPSDIPSIAEDGDIVERYRIVEDLDNDGDMDLVLSHPNCGMGHCLWSIYLRENDELVEKEIIGAHPKAISLEYHWSNVSRIWVYLKGAAWYGSLGYYEIKDGAVGDFVSLEIFPDQEQKRLSSKLYAAVFAEENRLYPQISKTTDGIVAWETYPVSSYGN